MAPEVVAFMEAAAAAGDPPLHTLPAPVARARVSAQRELIGPGPEVASVEELQIPVAGGQIAGRLYAPESAPATIVWFHGGGWVIGDLGTHDAMCRYLADASGCNVVAVDYRLAPEHPFPTPLEDCWSALSMVAERHGERPIVVGGDSAGGNLAAVCAIRARDRGGPELALQVLVYPVVDHDMTNASYRERGGGETLLGTTDMAWFFDAYAPGVADRDNPEISPLRTDELSGLPPAIVLTAEYDPLRDEGLAYAERLREAGNEVAAEHYAGMMHGFFSFVNLLPTGNATVAKVGRQITAALADRAARRPKSSSESSRTDP